MKTADPAFDIFVLCGVLISEEAYNEFDAKLKKLKVAYFGNEDVIFHSVPMRNKKGPFKIFQDDKVLTSFLRDFHEILESAEFTIISSVINKPAYKAKYPLRNTAYQEALKFMCERSVFCLRREDVVKRFIIYLEKRDTQDTIIKKYYTKNIKNGTTFMSQREMRLCEDELQSRKKKANINGLQLVDICAYPIARRHLTPDSAHPIYDIIEKKFYRSKKGDCKGYGLKVFP